MAASRTDQAEESGDMTDPGAGDPPAFRQAVAALAAARPRPEVVLSPLPPPRRLAPFTHALGASVSADGEELADGRFILLHDPAGDESWRGDFRVVTLARADLEPELATDPLLPEVAWSWLWESLEGRGLDAGEPNGTVTRAGSTFFGGLAGRPARAELELRASWTPADPASAGSHLLAWCGLLAQCAGLPPETSGPAVTALPRRRGPRPV
ncbi:DUF3000 domain-containing protein [Streptomyces litchfieldiae]|uniref:DUF3000 domain-containing protein n=1 Tax=Streptomyces litchfieldiae TaxID=3075543 RepID=A0ABU2MRB5_9ACTN|nr:DUF3000 domain-containing protein [Streptomyces sp. DSM 44938]MDT0344156.1 DUF3000 domain-containing protein [Streptomyces sp. DSM 44938]